MAFLPEKIKVQHKTLLEILSDRAQDQPDKQAYIFLQDGETESDSLTYGELFKRAKAIATYLKPWQGERALLLYPSGLEFITAFFGCLYAGVVAVPAYPPRRNQKLSRFLAIVNNSQAAIALTTTSIQIDIEKKWEKESDLAPLKFIATDTIQNDQPNTVDLPSPSPESLAFLQYTSGSTGTPKGVMVTHGNIIHNQQLIQKAFGHSEKSVGVGWLPLFHDMGLIGHVLQPVYVGFPSILMPPLAFLSNPTCWLKAISKYRATTSGGPNFAYDLCVSKVKSDQIDHLNLESWDLAYSGAEPVRAETLKKFHEKFDRARFNYQAFYPCYGMAETTLFTTGGSKQENPIIQNVQLDSSGHNTALKDNIVASEKKSFVSCGRPYLDTTVVIVEPESATRCQAEETGEIWVSGGSLASGYWNAPIATKETFHAVLKEEKSEHFLRTGDLGFLKDGELFVTGRLKDLIIIRGKNHYPQDIELTVQQSDPAFRLNCGAAFSVEVGGLERLVVVQELERTYIRQMNTEELAAKIRQKVAAEHELQVYDVVLIKTGSIAKTSSGKIQRQACRQAFLTGDLLVLGSSGLGQLQSLQVDVPKISSETEQLLLISELCDQIAECVGIPRSLIKPNQFINTIGLDSLQAVEIKNYIESNFGVQLPMEKFFEDITVAQLAKDILSFSDTSLEKELIENHGNGNGNGNGKLSADEGLENGNGKLPPDIDLDSRVRLVYKKSNDVLQRAREFELPDQLRKSGLLPYFRELERNEGTTCIFEGRQLVMLGSNNYLGLTADDRVRKATAKAAMEEGPSLTGSRLLNGSTHQHRAFERKLAEFVGHEDALIFTTGYQANLGFISALMNEETTILLDSEAHACIFDGAFMSRCKVAQYQHNDLQDLERKLQAIAHKSATMVVIDGLYSMTGDIAPLPGIRELCDRYKVTLAVDDAHSLGVLGATGKGTEEHFNMVGASDILCGTFSKSLASIGGWVAAEAKVIDWIRFNGRSMLFSASIPPTALAAASTALDILKEEPWRVQKLSENAKYWKNGLKTLGFNVSSTQTPIITVMIGDDMNCLVFCKELLEAGVYVNSAVYPAVPRTKALLRTSVMATHTADHLDKALEIFATIGKKLSLID
ncbi:MAG: aminotransferase class I/II-fold pyridoxal phosphate-dependent enzyme [Limnothrix sp.]